MSILFNEIIQIKFVELKYLFKFMIFLLFKLNNSMKFLSESLDENLFNETTIANLTVSLFTETKEMLINFV